MAPIHTTDPWLTRITDMGCEGAPHERSRLASTLGEPFDGRGALAVAAEPVDRDASASQPVEPLISGS